MKLIVNPYFYSNRLRRLKKGRGSGGGTSSGGDGGSGGSGSFGNLDISDQSNSDDVIELIYQYLSVTLEQDDFYSGDTKPMPTPNFTVTEFNGTILKLQLIFDDR